MIETAKDLIASSLDEQKPPNRLRRTVTLTVTHSCNLNCRYCYEPFKSSRIIPLAVAQTALRQHLSPDDIHDEVLIDLAGGEPTLAFDRIREICQWTWERSWPVPYLFFATTNGTLVHGNMQEWFRQNRHRIWLGLSLDGTPEMHNINRSNSWDRIDVQFFRDTWPKQSVKMTVSMETLDHLSSGVVFLHDLGFHVQVNLAYGVDWTNPTAQAALAKELDSLISYYVSRPDLEPCSLLSMPMSRLGAPASESKKWCGVGTDMVAIDVDAREYPCHAFLPLAQGPLAEEAGRIEWTNLAALRDPACRGCVLEPLCPTCYAVAHMESGCVWRRNRSLCELTKTRALACSKLEAERLVRNQDQLQSYDRGIHATINGIMLVQQAFGNRNYARPPESSL